MSKTLAFDVYGTLLDVHGVTLLLEGMIGHADAMAFSKTWRTKQLEYLFRRGLMGQYQNFEVCSRQALDYACQAFAKDLSDDSRKQLMMKYRQLPAFADVPAGLAELKKEKMRLYAFSNGTYEGVRDALVYASLAQFFHDIISVDPIERYKPDPKVYEYFVNQTHAEPAETWLVSSNPFDILGAQATGWKGVWVRRADTAVFDPWKVEPTAIIDSFSQLKQAITGVRLD